MIVVVEGPSAAGKTTWASAFDSRMLVREHGALVTPRDPMPGELADFWVEKNIARWTAAVEVERDCGAAICDTDPMKLHYDYSLARIGAGSWDAFDFGVARCRTAMHRERLGVADLVLVSIPDDETLDRRRLADSTRSRHNFDLHRRLGPAIEEWYSTLSDLDPGRVVWSLPADLPAPAIRRRYDVDLFDEWMRMLPRR